MNIKEIIEQLNENRVIVMPSDTIYGIFGKALDKSVADRIYGIKNRDFSKPFILMINDLDDLKLFGIKVGLEITNKLNKIWPNKVTVLLKCENKEFEYLHRGTKELAFRIPKNKDLVEILSNTGPLISTSANISNKPYAKTIDEAKSYFGNSIDTYIDGGYIEDLPSTLIKIENNNIRILRQGSVELTQL